MPAPEQAKAGWAHHGLAITRSGEIVGFHPDRAEVVIFDRTGQVIGRGLSASRRSWYHPRRGRWSGTRLGGRPGDEDAKGPDNSYQRDVSPGQGQVVKFGLDGAEVTSLPRPLHAAYETGFFAPTAVAVDGPRHGGNGDVWVADGYGESLVHRYSVDGRYLSTLTGEESPGGRFNCPHGLFVDRRHSTPELWVADRGNTRVQVYDTDGHWLRTVGEGFLNSPSAFATEGQHRRR